VRHEVQAAQDGSFSITVPAYESISAFYMLYYATPDTMQGLESNRLFSVNVGVEVSSE